jgi:hypothetical protein
MSELRVFRPRIEKDFEYFVRNITKLEPAEFCGLARILSVPMVRQEKLTGLSAEDIEKMGLDEKAEYVAELLVPMDVILEQMMDRFLELPKRRRKEIIQILKDA